MEGQLLAQIDSTGNIVYVHNDQVNNAAKNHEPQPHLGLGPGTGALRRNLRDADEYDADEPQVSRPVRGCRKPAQLQLHARLRQHDRPLYPI